MQRHGRTVAWALALVTSWSFGRLLFPLIPAAAWQGAQDNKLHAELAQMAEFELAGEGHCACVAGALAKPQTSQRAQHTVEEAHGYVETIGQIAQQTRGGPVPPWVLQMQQAIEEQALISCNTIWAQVIKEHLDQLSARQERNTPGGAHPTRDPAEGI